MSLLLILVVGIRVSVASQKFNIWPGTNFPIDISSFNLPSSFFIDFLSVSFSVYPWLLSGSIDIEVDKSVCVSVFVLLNQTIFAT